MGVRSTGSFFTNRVRLSISRRRSPASRTSLWPAGEAASFVSLRAKGAFVCSGAVGADGVVGDISVLAERGGNMSFASPWNTAAPRVVTAAGVPVRVESEGGGVFRAPVVAGQRYTIKP